MQAALLILNLLVPRADALPATTIARCQVDLTTITEVRLSASRERYKLQYGHLAVTTPQQNRAWIESKTDGHAYVYYTLDVMMRDLNTRYADKEFATALVHHILSYVVTQLSRVGLLAFAGVRVQADWKGLRLAVPIEIAAHFEPDVEDLFDAALARVYREIYDRKVIRRDDDLAPLVHFARGGTADGSDLRAKLARGGEVDEERARRRADESRAWFAARFKGSALAAPSGVPTRRVFALVKDFKDPLVLADVLNRRYPGAGVTAFEAVRLKNYLEHVATFTAGLHVVERVVVSLADAARGGASLDFRGMNAANLAATAEALARAADVPTALRGARAAEAQVTTEFKAKIAALKALGDFSCSGDDCVHKGQLSDRRKQALLDTLNAHPLLRDVRVSFIPAGVPAKDRHVLATSGETLEARLRLKLEFEIDPHVLDQLTLAVDARTKTLNRGELRVLIAGKVSPRERAIIVNAFAALVAETGVPRAYFAREAKN